MEIPISLSIKFTARQLFITAFLFKTTVDYFSEAQNPFYRPNNTFSRAQHGRSEYWCLSTTSSEVQRSQPA